MEFEVINMSDSYECWGVKYGNYIQDYEELCYILKIDKEELLSSVCNEDLLYINGKILWFKNENSIKNLLNI